jgi:hypothetical protein
MVGWLGGLGAGEPGNVGSAPVVVHRLSKTGGRRVTMHRHVRDEGLGLAHSDHDLVVFLEAAGVSDPDGPVVVPRAPGRCARLRVQAGRRAAGLPLRRASGRTPAARRTAARLSRVGLPPSPRSRAAPSLRPLRSSWTRSPPPRVRAGRRTAAPLRTGAASAVRRLHRAVRRMPAPRYAATARRSTSPRAAVHRSPPAATPYGRRRPAPIPPAGQYRADGHRSTRHAVVRPGRPR